MDMRGIVHLWLQKVLTVNYLMSLHEIWSFKPQITSSSAGELPTYNWEPSTSDVAGLVPLKALVILLCLQIVIWVRSSNLPMHEVLGKWRLRVGITRH
jgi:hypothetical protein